MISILFIYNFTFQEALLFEIELAGITMKKEERRNKTALNNKVGGITE